MQIVTYHYKVPEGWGQFKSAPIDSKAWDKDDRDWIDWMLQQGTNVVTIGHEMYQITTIEQ